MPCVVISSGIFEFEHAHFLVPMKILFSEVIRYKESPVTPQALLKKKSCCCCCTFFISNTFWRSIHNTHRAVCVDCKIIYMLFTGFGRSVLGETVPEVLSTQTKGTVSPNTDRPKPVNNIFIFFLLRFKSFRKIFLSQPPTYVCFVLMKRAIHCKPKQNITT